MLDIKTLFIRKLNVFLGASALVTLGLTGCDLAVDDSGIQRNGEVESEDECECEDEDEDEDEVDDDGSEDDDAG